MNALQEARRQTGINFADILYFDGTLITSPLHLQLSNEPMNCLCGPYYLAASLLHACSTPPVCSVIQLSSGAALSILQRYSESI